MMTMTPMENFHSKILYAMNKRKHIIVFVVVVVVFVFIQSLWSLYSWKKVRLVGWLAAYV